MTARAPEPSPACTVGVVLKGYPRLSETFIAQEIRALEDRGLRLRIISLRHPTDERVHPVHRAIGAPVTYLPEYLYREPCRVLRAWRRMRSCPGYRSARGTWLRDLVRDPSPNRVRRFGQALVLAAEHAGEVAHLHAHFLHTPASVARYAARLLGLRWTVSAHAKDIWTTPAWEKREKLAECEWAVTCTAANREHLGALGGQSGRVTLAYHGLDLSAFPPAARPDRLSDRGRGATPVILSVGRLVEKKGYPDLIAALARLPASLEWRFVHIGGGPLGPRLKRLARRLGVADRIDWRGAQPQPEVIAAYRAADVFVLASRIARDGDRDGLPNVLVEASSLGLACLATRVSAIPELIVHGESGWLVEPGSPGALAAGLERLLGDCGLRARLGRAAEARVRAEFGLDAGIDLIASKLAATLSARSPAANGAPTTARAPA